MSPVEKLTAAIAQLEQLRDSSTPGPWLEEDHADEFVGFIVGAGYKLATEITIIEDGQLIVTLHRTISAQIDLLDLALEYGELKAGSGKRFIERAVKLADAILGNDA